MKMLMKIMRRISIKKRITFFIILSIVLFSSVVLYTSRLISHKVIDNLKIVHRSIGKSIETILDEVNMLSVRLLSTEEIYYLLDNKSLSINEKKSGIRNILKEIVANEKLIGDIFIINTDDEEYRYMDDKEVIEKPDEIFINKLKNIKEPIGIWDTIKRDAKGNAYILFGRKYSNFSSERDLGYLIIYIRESALYDVYKKADNGKGLPFWLPIAITLFHTPIPERLGVIYMI